MSVYEKKDFGKQIDGRMENIVDIVTGILKDKGLTLTGEFQIIDGLAVYPHDFFCCFNFETQDFEITERTVSIHHYSASWTSLSHRFYFKLIKAAARILGKERYLAIKRKIKGVKR